MWLVLAVISFLLGQIYLFRCLGKLDQFVDTQHEEKMLLSIALADPILEEQMLTLLESYSVRYPNVDLVLYMEPRVTDAVRQRKADVGVCREAHGWDGPNCLTISLPAETRVIWNNNEKAREFVGYLWLACGK